METGSKKSLNKINELSVFISKDGFSFVKSVIENDLSIIIAKEKFNIDTSLPIDNATEIINRYIQKYDLQTENYKQVNIRFVTNNYVFVPAELFDTGSINTYYSFNIDKKEYTDELFFSYSNKAKCYTVFAFNKQIVDFLENTYPNANVSADIQSFIDECISLADVNDNYSVFFKLKNNFVDVVVLYHKELFVANTFAVVNEHDVLYAMLKPFAEMKIDQNNTPVYIFNDSNNYKDIVQQASRYIGKIILK